MDWQEKVARSRLVCSKTGQVIVPGEVFFSGLRLIDNRFVRLDFAGPAWQSEDPRTFLSWWRQERPRQENDPKALRVNHAVLLGIFKDLRTSMERRQQCFVWILVLLLVRARKLRLLQVEAGVALVVEDKAENLVHRIRDPQMSPAEEVEVTANLEEVMGFAGPGQNP